MRQSYLLKLLLATFLCYQQLDIYAQEPCPSMECCQDNEGFEDFPLGPFQSSTPFQTAGYYTYSGNIDVASQGHDDIKSLSMTVGTGTALAYTGGGGVAGPVPAMEAGQSYCIEFCLFVNSDNGPVNISVSTSSNVIYTSPSYTFTGSWETISVPIYTPTVDHNDIFFNLGGTAETAILLDNICIDAQSTEECMVLFSIQELGCGEYCFLNESCGENPLYVWDVFQGSSIIHTTSTTDLCSYTFPSAGSYTVRLTILGGSCDNQFYEEQFIIESDPLTLDCDDGVSFLIPAGEPCEVDWDLSGTLISGGSGPVVVTIVVNGIVLPSGTPAVLLDEGVHTIEYFVNDDCTELQCSYQVTVECEEVDKYDCPVDILFIMDNSGSVSATEYAAMATSAANEISSLSAVYTNSKFAITHYSGTCGENISIEHDFVNAASISSIVRAFPTGPMDDLDRSLDAVIDAFNGTPNAMIVSPQQTLNRTPGADLYIVIYTDALPNPSPSGCTNSAMTPYNSINTLKGSGFDANVTVVHFSPTFPNVAAVSGAIASPGGNSTVLPASNPGDPQGSSAPRQYIPASFTNANVDLLSTLPPCTPCADCDDLIVVDQSTNQDSCCYGIDINNGIGSNVKKLEAEIISPDWIFNTSTLSTGAGLTWYPGTTPTATKVCLTESATMSIPSGATADALQYCFAEATPGASSPQIVVLRWYTEIIDPNGEPILEVECTDTLITECIPVLDDPCLVVDVFDQSCNPDNSYEYFVNFTVTNNSTTSATHVSLNGAPAGYLFADCASSVGVPSISLTIPGGPLGVGGTSSSMCVKIISPAPILSPQNICFRAGIYSFMGDCCHAPELVCVTLEPCCDPCDVNTLLTDIDDVDNQCCHTLGIDNSCDYQLLTKVKATILTSGVQFGYHAIGSGASPNWQMCGSSAQMLCIDYIGGVIPKGTHSDLLDFCLDDIDQISEQPQQILIEYFGANAMNVDTVYCSDTLTLDCPFTENICLETSNQKLECIADSAKYRYTFDVTNASSIPFSATDLDLFVISPVGVTLPPSGGTYPLTPPLSSGSTQTISTCVVGTSFPITDPEIVFGYRLRYLTGDTCCYESVLDTIAVPICDDCCDEDRLDQELSDYLNTLIVDDCKVSLGPIELDSCVGLSINWGDGTGDHYGMDSVVCKAYDLPGIYDVCIQWEVYPDMGIFPCYLRDTCISVEVLGCEPDCMSISDIQVKDVICETADCYADPFCAPWLIGEIANISCTGFNDPYVEKATYNGTNVIIIIQPTIEGLSHRLYTCDGTLIQSCTPTGGGGNACNPDAGIDITTDLSASALIWQCGDAVPVLDLSCSSSMSIDYCFTLTNLSPYPQPADFVRLDVISPTGTTVSPTLQFPVIPQGMSATINMTVTGPLVPGDDIKIMSTLGSIILGSEWECSDTICMEVPMCPPPVDDCCTDQSSFDALVAQGLQITDLGDCTYQVCANQFDDCHWFWTASPDWDDGTVVLPTLTQSDAPNNCWTHTYSTGGPYTITLNIEEQNADGDACWDGQMQETVTCPPVGDCCTGYTISDLMNDASMAISMAHSDGCSTCVDGEFPDCVNWYVDWGDGSTSIGTSLGNDTRCHDYSLDGTYTSCLFAYVLDSVGDTCLSYTECIDIDIVDCADCCDISDDEFEEYFDDLLDYDLENCNETCFYVDSESCDAVIIDFGDGNVVGPISGDFGDLCHVYDDGDYQVCIQMYRTASDGSGDICIERDSCIDLSIDCSVISPVDCDASTWDIPNGLTPNGDGFNEVLKIYNDVECTVDVKVYNRWGQLVYNKNDYQSEWLGQSNNGENLPSGTYYLLIGTDSVQDGKVDTYITRYIDLRRE